MLKWTKQVVNVRFQPHPHFIKLHLLYQMSVVRLILLYSGEVTQFPHFPRESINFSTVTSVNAGEEV